VISLPDGSTLTVVRYAALPISESVLITVAGVIEIEATKTGFSQNFVLIERDDRLWIQADFLQVANDEFFAEASGDTFVQIEKPELPPGSDPSPIPIRRDRRRQKPPAEVAPDASPSKAPEPAPPPPPPPKEKPPRRRGGADRRRQKQPEQGPFVWKPDN
jgi:hypothetical protein